MSKTWRFYLIAVFSIVVNLYATLQLFVNPVYIQAQFIVQMQLLFSLLNLGFFLMTFAVAKTILKSSALSHILSTWSCLGWVVGLFECASLGLRLAGISQ